MNPLNIPQLGQLQYHMWRIVVEMRVYQVNILSFLNLILAVTFYLLVSRGSRNCKCCQKFHMLLIKILCLWYVSSAFSMQRLLWTNERFLFLIYLLHHNRWTWICSTENNRLQYERYNLVHEWKRKFVGFNDDDDDDTTYLNRVTRITKRNFHLGPMFSLLGLWEISCPNHCNI